MGVWRMKADRAPGQGPCTLPLVGTSGPPGKKAANKKGPRRVPRPSSDSLEILAGFQWESQPRQG